MTTTHHTISTFTLPAEATGTGPVEVSAEELALLAGASAALRGKAIDTASLAAITSQEVAQKATAIAEASHQRDCHIAATGDVEAANQLVSDMLAGTPLASTEMPFCDFDYDTPETDEHLQITLCGVSANRIVDETGGPDDWHCPACQAVFQA